MTQLTALSGGIIVLGLFKMNWTIEEAQRKFKSLANESFSSRELLKVPVFKNVAQIFCSFRYKSDGIDGALQKAFSTDPLFGQTGTAVSDHAKVGVVASMQATSKPYLFTNYSRNPTECKLLLRQ
jgi:hypothetical protein